MSETEESMKSWVSIDIKYIYSKFDKSFTMKPLTLQTHC